MPPAARQSLAGKALDALRLLVASVGGYSGFNILQKLALAYCAVQLAAYLRGRPWSPKHKLPADIQAILPYREPPDPELFPQYFPSPSTGLWLFTREWLPNQAPRGLMFVVAGTRQRHPAPARRYCADHRSHTARRRFRGVPRHGGAQRQVLAWPESMSPAWALSRVSFPVLPTPPWVAQVRVPRLRGHCARPRGVQHGPPGPRGQRRRPLLRGAL